MTALEAVSPDLQPLSGDGVAALSEAVVQGVLPFGLELNNLLAILAAALLVFVSGGVIYLSTVEWRDRRRRQQPVAAAPRRRR